jgi:hypothetical protein
MPDVYVREGVGSSLMFTAITCIVANFGLPALEKLRLAVLWTKRIYAMGKQRQAMIKQKKVNKRIKKYNDLIKEYRNALEAGPLTMR